MSDDEIKVPHKYLPLLRSTRDRLIPEMDYERDLLDRLIAAAEADAPPLPEGWVLLRFDGEARAVYWHHDGVLYLNDRCTSRAYTVGGTIPRDRLTPLRPTVDGSGLQRAAGAYVLAGGNVYWALRKAFEAAGIEVSDQ